MNKRVLLVEDDDDTREALQAVLRSRFDVACAKNGLDALSRVLRDRFDVLLLDLMMPVMDGASLMRLLAARGLATPVVLLSAHINVRSIAESLGAAAYLAKPFDLERLEQVIDGVTAWPTAEPQTLEDVSGATN